MHRHLYPGWIKGLSLLGTFSPLHLWISNAIYNSDHRIFTQHHFYLWNYSARGQHEKLLPIFMWTMTLVIAKWVLSILIKTNNFIKNFPRTYYCWLNLRIVECWLSVGGCYKRWVDGNWRESGWEYGYYQFPRDSPSQFKLNEFLYLEDILALLRFAFLTSHPA